ncbi:MAG: sensor histidine kinase [Pseudobacter sp.]|uniref:sensor histidine kinase n=1 Tax=Pseudobacter sp. TaxID=2045420 RepID=UPI003F80DEE7
MKLKSFNSKPAQESTPGLIWITIGAAIPLYIAAFFYTDAQMRDGEEVAAFLITVFFLLGIFAGRYAAIMVAGIHKEVPRRQLVTLSVIIPVFIIVVFIMAAATIHMSSIFMAMLLMGIPLLILSVSTGMLIKLVRISVKGQITEARADAAQSQSELQLLQSQLSPHFLFNTLNNIYGTSLTRHEKVPPLLLKLSDLLRYSVYEARELFVPLVSEVDYIKNYIEFEQLRIGEKLLLHTEIESNLNPQIKIAPLMLIVFIENAFKHAKNTTDQEIKIDIQLKTWGNNILFAVTNSNSRGQGESPIINGHSGFGLDSVRKRLTLLYPGEYDLSIQDNEKAYTVMLQIKAK